MSYVTARFGRPVAAPAGRKIPGPFSAARISPAVEARIGKIMAEAALREGHIARLPVMPRGGANTGAVPQSQLDAVLAILCNVPQSRGRVAQLAGISSGTAKRVLTALNRRGLAKYRGGHVKAWEAAQ